MWRDSDHKVVIGPINVEMWSITSVILERDESARNWKNMGIGFVYFRDESDYKAAWSHYKNHNDGKGYFIQNRERPIRITLP